LEKFLFKKVHNKIMIEILSITFFSGMMSIFIIILLLMGALLLIGKNPFKGFSLTALVTTKPLAAKLSPYGKSTSWQYGLGTQKGGTTIKGGWREKQTGKPIGLGAQTSEAVKTGRRYFNVTRVNEITSYYTPKINNVLKEFPSEWEKYKKSNDPVLIEYRKNVENIRTIVEYSQLKKKEEKGFMLTKDEKTKFEKLKNEYKNLKPFIQKLNDSMKMLGMEAQRKNTTTDTFAKVAAFSEMLGLNLKKPFLEGVAAETMRKAIEEGKDQKVAKKEAEQTTLNTIIEYNKSFIREMRGGSAVRVLNKTKEETGATAVFDLPYEQIEVKDILKEAENTKKVDEEVQHLEAIKLENLMEFASFNLIIDAKNKNQPIPFSYVVTPFGISAFLKQQKTQKGA